MPDFDLRDSAHRDLALDLADASERDVIESFLRCERQEAVEFLRAAAKVYQMRREYHRAETRLYTLAANKIERVIARLGGDSGGDGLSRQVVDRSLDAITRLMTAPARRDLDPHKCAPSKPRPRRR